jgi:hypothetical protein
MDFNKLKALGTDMLGKATEMAEQAKEKAGPLAEQAREKAGPLAQKAKEAASKAASEIDSATGGKYGSVSDRLDGAMHRSSSVPNGVPTAPSTSDTGFGGFYDPAAPHNQPETPAPDASPSSASTPPSSIPAATGEPGPDS